jgi:hypothetical protein
MTMRGRVPTAALAVLAAAALAACGGGGGGGGGSVPGGPPPGTPVPSQSPGPQGYVAPTGAITLLGGNGATAFSSGLMGSSADGVMIVQSPATPTTPPAGGALAQFAVTAGESAAVVPGAAQRRPANANSVLAQRIAEDRAALAADAFRERAPNPASLRAAFASVRTERAAAGSVRRTRAAAGTVGDTRQFKILTSTIGNTGGCAGGTTSGAYECFTTITARLQAVGTHGNVWVDTASLATSGEFTIPGEFQTIAADFDHYYDTETAVFGPAWFPGTPPRSIAQCDAGGNRLPQGTFVDVSGASGTSVDVVITDALKGTGEGGYYYAVNELPQSVWDCGTAPKRVSNGTTMFVVTGNDYPTGPDLLRFNESYWLNTDVPRSMSHELQHLLHAHAKYLYPLISGVGAITFDDAFVDEGCSMLAEDLATDPAPGVHIDTPRYTYGFMLEPSLFSLTAFTGYQPSPTSTATNPPYGWYSNTAGSYGEAYLFLRYVFDRFGPTALTRIYQSTASSTGPVVAAANGEPFAQLYREFAIALAAQNTPAAVPPYTFSSAVVLRGTVQVPSRRASAPVRTFVFGGPQPPETFTAALPVPTSPLTPGASDATFLVDGGTLFVPAANGAGGAFLSVTGPGGFPGMQGALVQGALPTPAPSSQ